MKEDGDMTNLTNLWLRLFETSDFLGVNIGFWISMMICLIVVIVMNIVFWSMKPIAKSNVGGNDEEKE